MSNPFVRKKLFRAGSAEHCKRGEHAGIRAGRGGHGDRTWRISHRAAVSRIEYVRQPHALRFHESMRVATGRDGACREIDETRGVRRAGGRIDAFDADAPRAIAIASASDGEVATKVDEDRGAGELP